MKNPLIATLVLQLFVVSGHATDYSGVADVFAKSYLQEQIKAQTAEILNKHPEYVLSQNPQIGTMSIKVLGRIIAANDFLHADNDKDRAFAALQFMAPDPTAAMVLLAIQLGDAVLSLRHQRDLVRIYKEIAQINLETVKIYSTLYTIDFEEQLSLVNRMSKNFQDIITTRDRLIDNAVYRMLAGATNENVSGEDITHAIEIVLTLNDLITHLVDTYEVVKIKVNTVALGYGDNVVSEWSAQVQSLQDSQDKLQSVKTAITNVFKITLAARLRNDVNDKVGGQRDLANTYLLCCKVINHWKKQSIMIQPEDVDFSVINDCQSAFTNLNLN